MATIYEVAALAGVSTATVSRFFNGANVSPDTARRVQDAADRLRFVPNRTARRLRSQTSELIALLIPDIENPFFTALARGVEDRAQRAGYSIVLCNTDDDPEKETRYLDIAISEDMAGVILAPSSFDGEIRHLTDRGRPVVAVDRRTGLDIDAVMVDNRTIGADVTERLFDQGFRRVACIAGPLEMEWTEHRALGWRDVVAQRGDPADIPALLAHADYRAHGGYAAMTALLSSPQPPDAVITTNNLMGLGALQALAEAGPRGADIGIAVVGELPYPPAHPGPLTQVRLPARHLGTTAAAMLLDRIAGDDQPARTVVLRGEVVDDATRVGTAAL
jgi:LacI family transcriptional regulator